MCGRFIIMTEPSELRDLLSLGEIPAEFVPNSNISPGQFVPVVIDPVARNIELYKWGLIPGWSKDPKIGYKMFNARAETIAEKPSFRVPFSRRRCLIPADGFYEWKVEENKKNPYLFTMKDQKPFTFAGLWDIWRDPAGKELHTCTIITTIPNPLMSEYHDRMPVILEESLRWQWLFPRPPAELLEMLKPIDDELMSTPRKVDRLEYSN